MTTASPSRSELAPAAPVPPPRTAVAPAAPIPRHQHPVLASLSRHVLLDGFGIVLDLERSHGCRLFDAVTERELIDLYAFFASMPIGFNHPAFDAPDVQEELLLAARTKVANSDVYTPAYARFVETFARVVGIPPLERFFFVDGGSLAVENAIKAAMDWKVRKNLAAGRGERGTEILHFRHAFHGRSGYCLSLTNTDPRKTKPRRSISACRRPSASALPPTPKRGSKPKSGACSPHANTMSPRSSSNPSKGKAVTTISAANGCAPCATPGSR